MISSKSLDKPISISVANGLDNLLEHVCSNLQITNTQHKNAEDHYNAIGNWLDAPNSFLTKFKPIIYPQGSLRIATTIRPLERQEYDLDLVCEFQWLEEGHISQPVSLLDAVEQRLKENTTYTAIIERKKRCIQLKYKNDFHLDILPAYPDKDLGKTCLLVPDREIQCWKPSDPKGYAEWFESKTKVITLAREHIEPFPIQPLFAKQPPLKRVVQLIKRARDIAFSNKQTQSPISIVLTTLAGLHYNHQTSISLALLTILEKINQEIKNVNLDDESRLYVCNPSNPLEDLSERWDKDRKSYDDFVSWVSNFALEWRNLFFLTGKKLNDKLIQIFGEQILEKACNDEAQEKAIELNNLRDNDNLRIYSTGILSSAITGTTKVPKNTFYGE